jgi:broad specificity phosphatase PhoE
VSVELVYETHAITTDNEAGIATGWLPGALSAAGREGAAELGRRRRGDGLDVVLVSDLARAVETARIAFAGTGLPIVEDPRLRECNYGLLNGMPRVRLDAQRAAHVDVPWPDGESYRQVVVRTATFLEALARERDGTRVLVIAHSANHWALEHLLRGADLVRQVTSGMTWQPGWVYDLPTAWRAPGGPDLVPRTQAGG